MTKLGTPSATASRGGVEEVVELTATRLELSRARILARAWAAAFPETRRTDLAALFARHAIERLSVKIAPNHLLSRPVAVPFGRLDTAAQRLAESIGDEASRLPIIEALHFVTSLYPVLLTAKDRSALGAFYTPPVLCSRLLDQAGEAGLSWNTVRILDPAAGGGAFLIHSALRMREAMAGVDPNFVLSQIGSRLLGLELDPHAAGLAQAALEIVLADLATAVGRPVPRMVRCCDTLDEAPEANFDLVVGNPPYGRVTLTGEQRGRYARSLYGHANLYGVFTDIALRWAKPGGLVAYLTPASFLAGQYYASLRALLAREAPPIAMDFVHARRGVFEDVLQETMLAVYRVGGDLRRVQIHYLHVDSEREARVTRNGMVGLPAGPYSPWLAPREPAHGHLIARAETMAARLADWGYSVSTGPLVWNRFKTQLRPKAGGRRVHPLIWAEAVTSDGRFVFRAQKKNHAPYFKLEPGDDWLLVEQPCVLVQRTTAKEQARRLIAAEMPGSFVVEHGGVVVENHLNMVRPNGHPKVSAAVVAALLNSRVVDDLFRCMSGSVAVSAFELCSLPLPDVEALTLLVRLVQQGASRERIDAECARLYGEE
ncbi:HsdM family class I SAM-dependent methyltransferase [Pinisolibacter sp.]|uniref:HsdM family class I SAM-dependent methyltransferase n=1 Tax=Pinisolibacter sp. TaxID=2172024 RepID=UPI002FDE12E2